MTHAHTPRRLHGYGVRWDPEGRCYRVRNETTGQWQHGADGELASYTSFTVAFDAWRVFEPPRRLGE
ncbi:hypothetical protein [Kitasatospora sp. NPDC097643]|uniref:hypothetical protein n=1 Tax=Kitasatospora sp. NPDC097643 TaxID=3157230 RepID=UPI0033216F96